MAKKVFFSKCSVTHNTGIDNNIGYIYREKKKNEGVKEWIDQFPTSNF